jgi:molybdenum cofactor guanylyltransferase
MGRDKAALPFGPGETMLGRVVRLVAEVVPADSIVCVAAPNQRLPDLSAGIQVVRDTTSFSGPLAGLSDGLRAIAERADAVFACGCDLPLLVPAVVTRLYGELGSHEIAAPFDGTHFYPLPAVYRTSVLASAERLLATGERSLVAMLNRSNTSRVVAESLRDIDPELLSLAPCNSREEYEAALRRIEP